MDQRPSTSRAEIMEVAPGAKGTGRLSLDTSMARIWSEATIISGLEKRMRRNKMEDEDKTCADCEYAYFGLDGKDYCEWYGKIDLDDSACRWFHALPDMEEE